MPVSDGSLSRRRSPQSCPKAPTLHPSTRLEKMRQHAVSTTEPIVTPGTRRDRRAGDRRHHDRRQARGSASSPVAALPAFALPASTSLDADRGATLMEETAVGQATRIRYGSSLQTFSRFADQSGLRLVTDNEISTTLHAACSTRSTWKECAYVGGDVAARGARVCGTKGRSRKRKRPPRPK